MARRGYTKKPCHGCGGEIEHPSGQVCGDCKIKFKHAEAYNKLMDEIKGDTRVAVEIPSNWCHPHFFPKRTSDMRGYDYETIGEILRDLAKDISIETPKSYYHFSSSDKITEMGNTTKPDFDLFPNDGSNYEFTSVVIMNKSTYELLEKLSQEIKKELLNREDLAFDYGKNLLMLLNNGELSEKDFLKIE